MLAPLPFGIVMTTLVAATLLPNSLDRLTRCTLASLASMVSLVQYLLYKATSAATASGTEDYNLTSGMSRSAAHRS